MIIHPSSQAVSRNISGFTICSP